jgi:tRNA threonylcarbamoyl adenosine modification protein YeaZ
MTISLTIDTATSQTIVGLLDGDRLIFSRAHEGATDHGRAVSELVAEALAGNLAPDQVIVGMGPGPYTGLRVGIAFAQTFALARTIPCIGICSLDAITVDQSEYTVAIDARRKEIYWASYKDGVRVLGPEVSKPDEALAHIFGLSPSPVKMVELASRQNYQELFYLRRPDAVPTAERP